MMRNKNMSKSMSPSNARRRRQVSMLGSVGGRGEENEEVQVED